MLKTNKQTPHHLNSNFERQNLLSNTKKNSEDDLPSYYAALGHSYYIT